MAILVLQVSLRHSLLIWVVLSMTLLHLGSSMKVHVNYTSMPFSSDHIPDELNITIEREPGVSTYLHLTRVQHIDPNVPVYTLSMDTNGSYHHHLEQVYSQQTIAYYQDRDSEAAIELIIPEGHVINGSNFIVKGELRIGGERYTLDPNTRSKRDTSSLATPEDADYILVAQPKIPVQLHDYIYVPPEKQTAVETIEPNIPGFDPVSNTTSNLKRTRRQSKLTIYIDIVAVVDYSAYSRFLVTYKTKADTLQAVREYYAFIFNGVDMRYQSMASPKYLIRVRLVKLIITETAEASQLTVKFRVTSTPRDRIDANKALYALSDFAAGPGRDIVFPCDHVMLFTGYDLTSTSSSGSVSEFTTGLAFTNTLCRGDGKSSSIVEDLGGFQCVDTATHELGHSFSSPHDGDGNNCDSLDRYIMSSGGFQATDSNKYNPWTFSSCSINYITKFIDQKLESKASEVCLTKQLTVAGGVADIGDRLPGQEFSADDQCRMIYGTQSRYCRGQEFGTAEEICVSMYCFDPSTKGTCIKHKATTGTTCGNGKMCLHGKCVADSRAPKVDDNCVYGDQPGVAFESLGSKTCPEFINSFSGSCYQSVVRTRCCASCQKHFNNVAGCEYGDPKKGCTPKHCRYASSNTLKDCCGTCNYGSPSAPTKTRVLAANTQVKEATAQTKQATIQANEATTETKPQTYPTVTQGRTTEAEVTTSRGVNPLCTDNPTSRRVGITDCAVLRSLPILCKIQALQDACCLSCRESGF